MRGVVNNIRFHVEIAIMNFISDYFLTVYLFIKFLILLFSNNLVLFTRLMVRCGEQQKLTTPSASVIATVHG